MDDTREDGHLRGVLVPKISALQNLGVEYLQFLGGHLHTPPNGITQRLPNRKANIRWLAHSAGWFQ